MYRSIGVLLVVFLVLVSCSNPNPNQIDYNITVTHKDSIDQLKVEMKFMPSQDGITILEYPNSAWGQEELHNAIKEMALEKVSGTIEVNKDSGWIVLNHPENLKELQFRYVLQQDFENPITSRKTYRPIIQPTYFHLFSHNLFMVPKSAGESLDLVINWDGLGPKDVIQNSFGSQQKTQHLKTLPKQEFLEAIFVGGDFEVNAIPIKDNTVYLATRGEWVPFTVGDMKAILKETIIAQRDFWNDHTQEHFTVTMQPIYTPNGSSYQGTGITNSFATSFSNNEFMEVEQMVHLFNHELMHNWIGGIIKNENEEEQYWFSEGFTEYYAFKNIAKNNINEAGSAHFINEMNSIIRKLYNSPVFLAPNSEINYENFWASRDYANLPYYRGAVFAFYLDLEIRRLTDGEKSLDVVMHQILEDAREKDQKLNHDYFLSIMKPILGEQFQEFFNKHIENGEPLPLGDLFNKLAVDFSPQSDVFELGFTFNEEDKVISNVIVGSAAYMAGIRNGDKVISSNIWYGDIERNAEIGIERNGSTENLSFLPVKKGPVPQIHNTDENLTKLGF